MSEGLGGMRTPTSGARDWTSPWWPGTTTSSSGWGPTPTEHPTTPMLTVYSIFIHIFHQSFIIGLSVEINVALVKMQSRGMFRASLVGNSH